jgi:hypothetical protein
VAIKRRRVDIERRVSRRRDARMRAARKERQEAQAIDELADATHAGQFGGWEAPDAED